MPKQTVSFLKGLFSTGKRPTQQNFWDWIDSFVHKDDVASINAGTIGTAIDNYNNSLKAESPDGTVNTLGDVFKIFQNYSDNRNINNELKWGGIPERPTLPVALSYSATQRITFSNVSVGDWPATGGTSSSRIKTLKQLLNNISETTPVVVIDMHFIRHSILDTTSTTVILQSLSAVDVGINPRTAV